jgi:hypothetical protein
MLTKGNVVENMFITSIHTLWRTGYLNNKSIGTYQALYLNIQFHLSNQLPHQTFPIILSPYANPMWCLNGCGTQRAPTSSITIL